MTTRFLLLGLVIVSTTRFAAQEAGQVPVVAAIEVKLTPCKASRQGRLTEPIDIVKLIADGMPVEPLTHRGAIKVDDRDYGIYLPEAKSYPVANDGESDDDLRNTSALLAIDADGDGELSGDENWFANLPVRIADRMFDVVSIASDGTSILFRPSKSPLRGIVVGRKCPQFEFATAKGETFTDERLAGKPFILDVWSVT